MKHPLLVFIKSILVSGAETDLPRGSHPRHVIFVSELRLSLYKVTGASRWSRSPVDSSCLCFCCRIRNTRPAAAALGPLKSCRCGRGGSAETRASDFKRFAQTSPNMLGCVWDLGPVGPSLVRPPRIRTLQGQKHHVILC